MIDSILEWAGWIDGVLWGSWNMAFIAAVGLYLGVRSRFVQLRGLWLIWKKILGKVFASPRCQSRGPQGALARLHAAAELSGGQDRGTPLTAIGRFSLYAG